MEIAWKCPRCGMEFEGSSFGGDGRGPADEINDCPTKGCKNFSHFECSVCGHVECPDCDPDADLQGIESFGEDEDIEEFPLVY